MVSVIPVEYLYLVGFLGALFFLSRPINNYAKKNPRVATKQADPGGIKFNITIDKEDLKNEDTMNAVTKLMTASQPVPKEQKQMGGQMGMLQSLMAMPGMMKSIEGSASPVGAIKSAIKGGK